MNQSTIDLKTARQCNETGQEIEVGMYVVVNTASCQVLAVAGDVSDAHAAADEIESEHGVVLDVRLVD